MREVFINVSLEDLFSSLFAQETRVKLRTGNGLFESFGNILLNLVCSRTSVVLRCYALNFVGTNI